jgi:hypothetical protein
MIILIFWLRLFGIFVLTRPSRQGGALLAERTRQNKNARDTKTKKNISEFKFTIIF